MVRVKPNPKLIEDIVARVPEGFISLSTLSERLKVHNKGRISINKAVREGKVGRTGDLYYDAERLSAEQAAALSAWGRPDLPPIAPDGTLLEPPIAERRQERNRQLDETGDPDQRAVMDRLAGTDGYLEAQILREMPGGASALNALLNAGMLQQTGDLIYDPLRLSKRTMRGVWERRQLLPRHAETLLWLASQPGQVVRLSDLIQRVGGQKVWQQLNLMGGFSAFELSYRKGMPIQWVRLADADPVEAEQAVRSGLRVLKKEADQAQDEAWARVLSLSGDVVRPGAREGDRSRTQVIARTYTPEAAARHLGVRTRTLLDAVQAGKLASFQDPDLQARIPAAEVEAAAADSERREAMAGSEILKAKELAIVMGASYSTTRQRLQRERISTTRPIWSEVRGKWGLPDTLAEFREQLKEKAAEWRARRQEAMRAAEERRHQRWLAEQEREHQEREALRARLVAAFPAWRHEARARQHITLHIGPTNSGKTFDALLRLAQVDHGWYLAPLRLLAFEVYDTLNARGVPCNLLTGEERIDVPGAGLTAATVEMFNPRRSGQAVLIDEAHLLADPDRGWAWTRALMESEAPEMHVIGAPTARNLVERLARAAAFELDVVEHHRLTPLRVADTPWPLKGLPSRTILVAFSRAGVLSLKVILEQMGRTVSVVYGNLPPEVRRRQADRFAAGETEICVATDAVGMGLNLPADRVCFAEVYKFDGREQRLLTPDEIRQIGGRAGRYLLSEYGEVGATNSQELSLVRELFEMPPTDLTHARVAPSVEDIAMIPGALGERLERWAALESIPDELRGAIKTADMTERIELANMLHPREVDVLGLPRAMKLINAPTQQNTRSYWRNCVWAILYEEPMPLPPAPPPRIANHEDLEWAEMCIRSADIYLWLSSRREFVQFGPEVEHVRAKRAEWSRRIDEALVRKVDAARRCIQCSRRLPYNHRFRLCDECYRNRRAAPWDRAPRDHGAGDGRPPRGARSRSHDRAGDVCPVCHEDVGQSPAARLEHWRRDHPDITALTAMRAAWLLGIPKSELKRAIPFDFRAEQEGYSARLWKLSTLETAIANQSVGGRSSPRAS